MSAHGRGTSPASRWASLAAVWVHLGAFVLANLAPGPRPDRDLRYIEVVRTEVAVGEPAPGEGPPS
ncbi:MAG: hypothetical protein ABMB14_40625, partial [Myxococcota bacterium]